jgi:integrase
MSVRYRRASVTIYGKSPAYPRYRLAFYAEGKRHIRTFCTYAVALAEAKAKVRAIAKDKSTAATLDEGAARSYKSAISKLNDLARELNAANPDANAPRLTLKLDDVIAEYIEAKRKVGPVRLIEAANAHAATVATINRKSISDAVAEFLAERKARTIPEKDGARPKLSQRMYFQDRLRLERFSGAFTMDLCDLGPGHLDIFFTAHLGNLAPKSKNHFRGCLSLFLKWAVRRKYLTAGHSLDESDQFRPGGKRTESTEVPEVQLYTPGEFSKLLAKATGPLQALVAIQGFAGLRVAEALRLSWEDVWRRKGYVEVVAVKSKTRSRRLIPIGIALAAWLADGSEHKTGRIWPQEESKYHKSMRELHSQAQVTRRDNALRHGYVSYRLAVTHDENRVASESGTSPAMIHRHYRETATAEEGTAWFAVLPDGAAGNVLPNPKDTEVAA